MPELAPIDWPFQGFALVQSVKLPEGSRYEVRKSWNREQPSPGDPKGIA